MVLDRARTETIKDEYRRHEADTGSAGVQIALLTERIKELADHLETHKKDHSSRSGLLKMVSKRRRFLDYLKDTDKEQYKDIISRLKLRR
ncbi:MAG: 30S ribosomal protein S15 [Candidatus Tritonobacter lacicola]|nr:30S ribosomal protein S15 [Candidatus Tritonobacter lacicola]